MSIIQNEHDPLTSVPPSSMTPRAQSHSVNVDHPLATLGKLVRKSSTPPARLENLAFEPRLLWCRGGVPAAGKPGCPVRPSLAWHPLYRATRAQVCSRPTASTGKRTVRAQVAWRRCTQELSRLCETLKRCMSASLLSLPSTVR